MATAALTLPLAPVARRWLTLELIGSPGRRQHHRGGHERWFLGPAFGSSTPARRTSNLLCTFRLHIEAANRRPSRILPRLAARSKAQTRRRQISALWEMS